MPVSYFSLQLKCAGTKYAIPPPDFTFRLTRLQCKHALRAGLLFVARLKVQFLGGRAYPISAYKVSKIKNSLPLVSLFSRKHYPIVCDLPSPIKINLSF